MPLIIESVRNQLLENVNDKTKETGKRYFKEEIQLYGVKTAAVTKVAKQTFKMIDDLSKKEIFDVCEELWRSNILEESFIACNWAYAIRSRFTEDDFVVFEKWVNEYISNWASCDTLCNHTIGAFIEMHPGFAERLKEWSTSQNRWVRRASAVSFILPARKGIFKEEIFEIAGKLLLDPDDLVQKGYGWMLKSLAEVYEDEVYQFILDKKSIMPRTALRYAIEKMPETRRREAMKKHSDMA